MFISLTVNSHLQITMSILKKRNFTAGLCLQGMKWLCEMPMGSMACFFRQAEYKCEDFLFFYPAKDIWPPQINEFPNYIACQLFKSLTESQVYKSLCLALPANRGSFFSSNKEGVHVCQGRGKAAKIRCSAVSDLKCYSTSNALPSPTPSQEEPCQA